MNVVGNNISNINTVGFKGARMDFQDFISQYIGTAAGMGQVGRGTSIGIVMNDFSQGSFETTTDTTDIAIMGNGFFKVIPKNSNTDFYTRAGNFRFDKDGFLTDPHGYVLQGWKVDNTARSLAATTGATSTTTSSIIGTGTPVDIRLDTFSCPPRHTSNATMAVNLDSGGSNDKISDPDDPFFAMLKAWDATPNAQGQILPLGSQSYAFPNTIEVFDEGGQSHKLTVYFDRVTQTPNTNIDNLRSSDIVWEYIVTCEPGTDLRNFTDNPSSPLADKYKGLLMAGTMTFDSAGQFRDQTAYVPTDNNMGDLSTWRQAPISANGYPMLAPNFSGREGASSALDMSQNPPTVNRNADGFMIEMNFGLRSTSSTWDASMPTNIGAWSSPVSGGTATDWYRVERDANRNPVFYQKSTSATPPASYPVGQSIGTGPVITWQADTPLVPGEVEDTATNLIYVQRAVSQGLRTGEAAGVNALIPGSSTWVYQELGQQTIGGVTGTVFYDSSGPGMYIQDSANPGDYYALNLGGTPANPATWTLVGGTTALTPAQIAGLTVSPDPTRPVSTNTAAVSSNPKFIVDGSGNIIQATVTSTNPGMGVNAERQNTTTTSFRSDNGNNFFERFAAQDGYTYGELRYVNVSQDGVLSAAYSNGVTLELYQITLHDFPSKQNLRREGGNLFTETRASGLATTGAAGTGSFGTTESNSLEQSNVDLSREFVNMITTQKGFQANSKSITTVDTMLDTVINMKR